MAQQIQRFGLAIDWETSGYSVPNYAERHQGLSFGAVIFDLQDFTPVDTLYLEIKHDPKYVWDEGAAKVHGLTKERLEKDGVTQAEAAVQLAELIFKYMGTEKIVALGHRVYFDIAFTNQLMSSVDFELQWDPIKIDSASIALTFLGITRSDELFAMMGLPPRGEHNALEDIIYTLESVKMIRSYFIQGLSGG